MSITSLLIVFFAALLFGVPFGIISFVLMHKTYGARKAVVLICAILFFVLYGLGFILIPVGYYVAPFYFMIFSIPLAVTSFILVITRPGNFAPKQPSINKQNLSYLDELERLKKLLDCGAITKEEYDSKKSEILNRK